MSRACSESVFFTGEIIGDCILQKNLRVHEMHEVWIAYDRTRQTHAVLKLIRNSHPRIAVLRELADFLTHTDCPQLIHAWNTSSVNGWFAAELEYASGGSLASRLKQVSRMPLGHCIFIMREILSALHELHRHGIIHRDLKTGNVWTDPDGGIKVGDLGIARSVKFPETGPAVFGTPSAMSPEQTRNTAEADCRSDFFSLSSLMFELLTGHPRFPRAGLVETARLIREAAPEDMKCELEKFAPPGFTRLLMWMAAPEKTARPPDAQTVLEELEQLRLPCEPPDYKEKRR